MSGEGPKGYGPRCRLLFNGEEGKYELWEVKFMGYLRTVKLHGVVTADAPDAEKNAQVFAELVQLLDDTSLSLVIRDARDKGKEALMILRDHYLGSSKPRIISLYTELTSLKMAGNEKVTDYMIRAETASASLKAAGETISDSLLIAMVLKGLPQEYKTFSTVVTQKDAMSFKDFKISLRSCEETEKGQNSSQKSEDSVIYAKQEEKKSAVKCVNEINENDDSDSHTFVMKVNAVTQGVQNGFAQGVQNGFEQGAQNGFAQGVQNDFESDTLLVDSGSSTHIVTN
ncbi:unnamed protein product, partial [Meganyctiphanes norvegica]